MAGTIHDVIDRMRAIAEATVPGDGVGYFNGVYLRTTRAILDRLGTGFFEDDGFVERFDVVFADLYFDAIDDDAAGRRLDAAWRPLFTRRADRRVHALQFVVAGMNAHIGHDLELAVVRICAAEGTHPLSGSIPADFHRITDVLEAIESQVRLSLLTEAERELGRLFEPLAHLVGSWSIARARQGAWIRAQILWQLRDTALFDQAVAISASTVGMTGRHLLTPLLPADR